jgi:hypothetical protein
MENQNTEQVTRKEFDNFKACSVILFTVSICLIALALLIQHTTEKDVKIRLINLKDQTVDLKADLVFRDAIARINNSKIDRIYDLFISYDDKYISKQSLIDAGVAHYICDPVTGKAKFVIGVKSDN